MINRPFRRTFKLEVRTSGTCFTGRNVPFCLPEAHWMRLISIHLSQQVGVIYSNHIGRRKQGLELVLDAVWAISVPLGPTSVPCLLFQLSLSGRHWCLSIPTTFVNSFWVLFLTMGIILWVWRCLRIVNVLCTSSNVYFKSRDLALLQNDLTKCRWGPASVIFSIEAFWSFWSEHHETWHSEEYIFCSRFFSKAIFYYIRTGLQKE